VPSPRLSLRGESGPPVATPRIMGRNPCPA
jgi:hypothetical protein